MLIFFVADLTLVQLITNDNDATQFYTAWVTIMECFNCNRWFNLKVENNNNFTIMIKVYLISVFRSMSTGVMCMKYNLV